MRWPCRLLAVEPVGETWAPSSGLLPHKVACTSLRVVEEVPATLTLGPQADEVVALIERCTQITVDDAKKLAVAWAAVTWGSGVPGGARDATWSAARTAAWDAARSGARDAARDTARDAARAAARDAAWAAARAGKGSDRFGGQPFDPRRAAAARDATWDAAAWAAAWDAVRDTAAEAARDAAAGLVVRDLIGEHRFTQEHYDLLTLAWRSAVGPIHPDDAPIVGDPA
jgi:hypothetical protein